MYRECKSFELNGCESFGMLSLFFKDSIICWKWFYLWGLINYLLSGVYMWREEWLLMVVCYRIIGEVFNY